MDEFKSEETELLEKYYTWRVIGQAKPLKVNWGPYFFHEEELVGVDYNIKEYIKNNKNKKDKKGSKKSFGSGYSIKPERVCIVCGYEFNKTYIGQKTCCLMCEDVHQEREKRKISLGLSTGFYKLPMTKRCPICDELFEAKQSNYITCGSEYCKKVYGERRQGARPNHKRDSQYYLEKDDLTIEKKLNYDRKLVDGFLKDNKKNKKN